MENEKISLTADRIEAGGRMSLGENHIMSGKELNVTFCIDGMLTDSDIIRIGHGERCYGGSYIELSKDGISQYHFFAAENSPQGPYFGSLHGLDLSGTVDVRIACDLNKTPGKAYVTVTSGGKSFSEYVGWNGRNGDVFMRTSCAVYDVRMQYSAESYKCKIWLLGDSYFNTCADCRWPYYMIKDGYTDVMLMGYPGRDCESGIADFLNALEFGTPEYAVWCLGMNNGDTDSINQGYAKSAEKFLTACIERGITPILSTTPTTPKVNNVYKNAFVRNAGYRYIDFAAAVEKEYDIDLIGKTYETNTGIQENKTGYEWKRAEIDGVSADYLFMKDLVHPDKAGARALYEQVLKDFPEIKGCTPLS